MLKIHKPFSKRKLFFLGITSICIASGLCALSYLTYTPELSHAETVSYRSLDDITYMQEMTAAICKASVENETKQLIDSRDGKSYWVTKLKDDNCWMTQNLDLDLANRKLTTADSDVLNDWTSTTGASGLWTGSSEDYNTVKYYDPGEYVYSNPSIYIPNGCGTLDGEACVEAGWSMKVGASADTTGDVSTHYLIGNYYSWGAATAGQAASLVSSTAGEQSTQSICSKGWTLPVIQGEQSYQNLLKQYGISHNLISGDNDMRLAPLYFLYSGSYSGSGGSIKNAGGDGLYWSSTASSYANAYYMLMHSSINSNIDNPRYLGLSVRCIARTDPPETRTLSDLTYMQDMTMDVCKNSEVGESKQLIDKRKNFNGTNPSYWVEKLRDNNCWMTQNLDLDIPAEGLKAEDTDIPKDWNSSSDYPPEATQTGATPSGFNDDDAIVSWDPAQGGTDKYCVDNKCNNLSTTSSNNGHDTQGNYYSWGAATAGQAATLTSDTAGEQATQSICPKGWNLPHTNTITNDTSEHGSFQVLLNGLDATQIISAPYYFILGGFAGASTPQYNANNVGYYWSSVAQNGKQAYFLRLNSQDVNVSSGNRRQYGFSIRCVSSGGEKAIIDNNNIKVTINPQLSLDVANEVVVGKTEPNPSTATLDAKVSSNMPYAISISSDSPDLSSSTSTTTITATNGLLNTAVNGWGIKKYGIAGIEESNYTAITKDLQTFYTASGAEIKTIPFTIGISTAPDLPNGEYSTDITITATQN